MWNSVILAYVFLLLLPFSSLQLYDRDLSPRRYKDVEALEKLRTIKRRVSFKNKQREPLTCRGWHSPCIPWTSEPGDGCCANGGLVCRCNLWMQNCRCVARTWG
ncbi:hypothetical protein SNE40_018784 [Patella caerulea]|uniref:Uncharacterized protein n=1 Tax=Patella caerulea TaxID=87958 RepID=A0AAN8J5M2_PATCE